MATRSSSLIAAAAIFCGAAAALPAQASVVTFNEIGIGTAAPFSSGGLLFNGSNMFVWNGDGVHSDNGTNSIIMGFSGSLTITKDGGGAFSLDSLDAGLSWYTSLVSLGVTVGGESITLIPVYQTFSFSTLTDVNSVTLEFAPDDGYLSVDNIVWHDGTVPEPGTLALAGLALLAMRRSRPKAAAVR